MGLRIYCNGLGGLRLLIDKLGLGGLTFQMDSACQEVICILWRDCKNKVGKVMVT